MFLVPRSKEAVVLFALSLTLNGFFLSVTPAQAQFGGVNLQELPGLLDIESRQADLAKKIDDALLAGRLTALEAEPFKKELARLKDAQAAYKASGKFSLWQKARITLELDLLATNLEKGMHERTQIGLTDLPAKKLDLETRLDEALKLGRLSSFEGGEIKTELAAYATKEAAYKSDSQLSSSETLELALELDKLSAKFEAKLKARSGGDLDFAARRGELDLRIKDLTNSGRISSVESASFSQELQSIAGRESILKSTGLALTAEQQLSLALDLERLNSKLERYTAAGGISAGMPGIDAMQASLISKLTTLKVNGKVSEVTFGELKQEFDRIESAEASYRADGQLNDAETLTLAGDLEKLAKRIDTVETSAPVVSGLAVRQAELLAKLDQAKLNQRITEVQYQDLRLALERVASRERLYRADGVLSDSETLSLASELDQLNSQLSKTLVNLPNLAELRQALEKKIQDALASSRLNAGQAGEFNGELSRIAQLEAAFKGGGTGLQDSQVLALAREYQTLNGRFDRAVVALPDVTSKKIAIDKKISDAQTTLSAVQISDVRRELARIIDVETSFRQDGVLNDWEVMTLARDLDRLDGDLSRIVSQATSSAATSVVLAAPGDTKGHWAESYVAQLVARNIIGGFPDGTFKPDANITRAQFAAIAMKALKISQATEPANFNDVPAGHWANKAIASVSKAGLVTGFPDGTFKPEDKITRTQALVILAKALPASVIGEPAILNSYQDGSSVPSWAAPSVARAAKSKIIVSFPDPSQIKPNLNATRADVAALTYQTLFNLGEKLPVIKVGLEP
jgi:hypothetical protein